MRRFIETAMQRLVLSTNDVPEAQRFSYWRAAISDGLIGVRFERDKGQDRPFNGRLVGFRGGSVALRARGRADGCTSFRERREIARLLGSNRSESSAD